MCQPPTPLETYAARICSATKQITTWCNENNHPHPSLDPQAPSITLPPSAPEKIQVARQTIIESALKVNQLVTEPNEYLPRLAVHYQLLSCINWICHFRILSFISLEGSVPLSDVAAIAMVPENQLRSVTRMAMTSGFLCEPVPGQLGHTATSRLFVTNPAMVDWALFMAGSADTASKLVEATEKWGATDKKDQTAFNISRNTELSFFEYISQTPDIAKLFVSYMKNVTSSEGTKIEHLVKGYDWGSLGEATVVDMGGSDCHASIALAHAYPALRFIVQDLPDTISNGPLLLAAEPEDVRNHISCQTHNFFQPQPVANADVYFLRMIFHDWPDAEAAAILRNLLPVLTRPGVRLIIMDTVLPDPGSVPANEEALMRVRDLTMLQAFNSKERSMADWTSLFKAVSVEVGGGELNIKSVGKPFGSLMSLMEVIWVPSDYALGVGEVIKSGMTTANGHAADGLNGNGLAANGHSKNGLSSNGLSSNNLTPSITTNGVSMSALMMSGNESSFVSGTSEWF